jgi:hypothetical protein
MGHITRTLAAAAAGLVLTAGLAGAALADDTAPEPAAPCATQSAQVAKAEGALARVTAVFERTHVAVADAEAAVAAATTPRQKAAAKNLLRKAQAAELKAVKAKKAQQQRLTKAQERLDTCLAEQPPTEEPPVEEPPVEEPPVVA